MLTVLADSLLLATRMRPINDRFHDERDLRANAKGREPVRRRQWFGLMGIRL